MGSWRFVGLAGPATRRFILSGLLVLAFLVAGAGAGAQGATTPVPQASASAVTPVPTRPAPQDLKGRTGEMARRFRVWSLSFGPAGPVVYGLAYALAAILFLPALALTLGAGAAFGLKVGFFVVWLGSALGAAISFLAARYLFRHHVQAWLKKSPRMSELDRAVARSGWKLVALTRLSPIVPYGLLNYGLGVTSISFLSYVTISALAEIPGAFVYVYAGCTAYQLASEEVSRSTIAYGILGMVATIYASIFATQLCRQALQAPAGPAANPETPAHITSIHGGLDKAGTHPE
jgi:uncharacterized membrane protein YdjX (TVP38/TMEM64 family)